MKHHNEYNAYVFGGSRASFFSVDTLNKYHDGLKFYNLWVHQGNTEDYKGMLRFLIFNKIQVKKIVVTIGLDELYTQLPRIGGFKMHHKVNNENMVVYYIQYLISNDFKAIFNKLKVYYSKGYKFKKQNFIYGKYIPNEGVSFQKRDIIEIRSFIYKKNVILNLKEIDLLCKENGIEVTYIILPHCNLFLKQFRISQLNNFFDELSEYISFYCFAYINYYNTEKFYYEISHFKEELSIIVENEVFMQKHIIRFGKYYLKSAKK